MWINALFILITEGMDSSNSNIAKLISNGVQEIYAMVSPKNEASIKSFINAGFSFKRDSKYKEIERLILKWEL